MDFSKYLSILVLAASIHFSLPRSLEDEPALRITWGDEVEPHSLPFMVAVKTEINFKSVLCGGTLVSRHFVLTAARCLYGSDQAELLIGAHNLTEEEDGRISLTVDKKNFIIHEEYNVTDIYNDLALVLLPEPVNETDTIKYIALPEVGDMFTSYEEEVGTIAGWGKTSDVANGMSDVLYEAHVTIIPLADCEVDNVLHLLQLTQMCSTGVSKSNLCLGDNGGPIIVDGVQVGIASFGSDFGCEVGFPGVYTRTGSYLNWLKLSGF